MNKDYTCSVLCVFIYFSVAAEPFVKVILTGSLQVLPQYLNTWLRLQLFFMRTSNASLWKTGLPCSSTCWKLRRGPSLASQRRMNCFCLKLFHHLNHTISTLHPHFSFSKSTQPSSACNCSTSFWHFQSLKLLFHTRKCMFAHLLSDSDILRWPNS